MGLLDAIERLITEHGSAAILKERLELAAQKYAELERQHGETQRRLEELESRGGVAPLRLDLNQANGTASLLTGEREFGGLRLGFGITLHAHASANADGSSELLAVTTKWLPFGHGQVRSGWLFHAGYPEPAPEHTFSPHALWERNARHATLFFKLHTQRDGTGYVHLLSASDHVCTLTLQTTRGDRVSGAFRTGADGAAQRASDVWHFSIDPGLSEEA